MHDQFKSIREAVLAKIKKEQVTPHPRAYFVLQIIALAAVSLAVLGISVFLCNFIFFAIRISGSRELLGFGNRGLAIFFHVFPWWLLVLDIGLIVLLEGLLRRFRFGYRSPILYLLFALLVITISTGYTLDRATLFNDFLHDRAHEHRLPGPLNFLYERPAQ